jgi:hypothetical protein
MRVLTVVGLALAGSAATLQAQHAHQLEFGGFGTYTHYDASLGLNAQAGGGGRVGFFLSEYFGLEADVMMNSPFSPGGVGTAVTTASGSLVINSGGEHNVLYVLGGYTRYRQGGYSPYYWLNEVHGGVGDRVFFGNHIALRLEGRVLYAPGDQLGSGKAPLTFTGSAGVSFFLGGRGGGHEAETPQLPKQTRDSIIAAGGTLPPVEKPSRQRFVESGADWAHQWFWGAQAGIMVVKTDEGTSYEPIFGGHWLITAKRTALYVAYEQAFFLSDRHATILEPDGTVEPSNVAFKGVRRIMMGALAFPAQKHIQPFAGAGFAIMEVLNPVATCTNCSVSDLQITQNEADAAGSKGFFWLMGGIEARQGRLTLYGHYILTSAPAGFLINGNTHTFQGGLRYSLGSSKEEVTTGEH